MPEPRYRQIADSLRQRIESGELRHGDQLPTEMELQELYDASRNTVRDAVKWLTIRGLVEPRAGHGTFVIEKFDPFITTLDIETGFGEENAMFTSGTEEISRKASVSAPRIEIHQAGEVVAAELRIPEGSQVISRLQQRYIDGTPWSLQSSYYPMRYFEAGATKLIEPVDMPDGVVRYLAQTLGIKQVGWRDRITVRAPEASETSFFKLPDDGRVAVFEVRRIAYEDSGEPLRLSITAYPTDRNQFIMNAGKVPGPGSVAFHIDESRVADSRPGDG